MHDAGRERPRADRAIGRQNCAVAAAVEPASQPSLGAPDQIGDFDLGPSRDVVDVLLAMSAKPRVLIPLHGAPRRLAWGGDRQGVPVDPFEGLPMRPLQRGSISFPQKRRSRCGGLRRRSPPCVGSWRIRRMACEARLPHTSNRRGGLKHAPTARSYRSGPPPSTGRPWFHRAC